MSEVNQRALTVVGTSVVWGVLLWNFHDVNLGATGLLAVPVLLSLGICVTFVKAMTKKEASE